MLSTDVFELPPVVLFVLNSSHPAGVMHMADGVLNGL
jgi:hypothetical protein